MAYFLAQLISFHYPVEGRGKVCVSVCVGGGRVGLNDSVTLLEIVKPIAHFRVALKPLYQNEARCTIIHMKMSLIYM